MSSNGRTRPDAEPGPSGSEGGAGSSGVRFFKMSAQEAVDRDVHYAPIAITGLEHHPRHIPKMQFDELREVHEIPILANATRIVRLWNVGQPVPPYKMCKDYGTDVLGYTAWCLEEDVGPENFWNMLRQQASPPVQTDKDLYALWIAAKERRSEVLRARVEAYFPRPFASPYPAEPAHTTHH
jgi:hypothetical protein